METYNECHVRRCDEIGTVLGVFDAGWPTYETTHDVFYCEKHANEFWEQGVFDVYITPRNR